MTNAPEDPEVAAYIAFLDGVRQLPGAQQQKQRMAVLLQLTPGARVLDVGCGTGDDVRELAAQVGTTGWSVGVDRHAALIAEARKRAAGSGLAVEFHVGDIAHLDFAEHTFDGTRAERLFEHLAQPELALAELVRVTCSGGRIVLASPDMDTNLIDHPDRDLTRKIRHFESDCRPNGLAGQQLYGLMRGVGLTDLTAEGIVLISTDYEETMSSSQLRERAERAQAAGVITPAEQRRWLEGLARYGATNRFFLATTYFIVSGRKP